VDWGEEYIFDWGRPEGRKIQKKENGIGWKVMIPTGKRDSGDRETRSLI
jgi:hypothetical protein